MDFLNRILPLFRALNRQGVEVVDIMTRLGTAFRFEDLEAETRNVHGIPVQVATPATLYRMKKGTVRPVDWGDAAALREMFDLEDDD
jgi:hypothetical protein